MRFIITILLTILILGSHSRAQREASQSTKTKKVDPPKAHVTIIALGPIAKKRYHIPKRRKSADHSGVEDGAEEILEEGLPELLPPKPGESPPPALYYKGRKNAKQYERIRVGFNNPASINKLKPNRSYQLYRRNEETGEDYESYFSIPALPEHSQTLMLLTQNTRRSNRWFSKPVVNAIDLNSDKLKDAVLYMKNLSSERVYLKAGNEKETLLMPGADYVFQGKGGQSIIMLRAGKGRLGRIPLIRTGVRVPKGNLTTFAFYNADPATNSGKSVGVCRVVTTRLKLPQKKQK